MPQGLLHQLLNQFIAEVLIPHLRKKGIVILMDMFVLYRDEGLIRRRIAPDLMLDLNDQPLASDSWDLDMRPVPVVVGEITSPASRKDDFESNRKIYESIGVETYFLIDGLNEKGEESGFIEVHLWRKGKQVAADSNGFLDIPELQIKAAAKSEAELQIVDRETLKPLLSQSDKDQQQLIKELQEKLKEQSG